jgi:hypothetical protein
MADPLSIACTVCGVGPGTGCVTTVLTPRGRPLFGAIGVRTSHRRRELDADASPVSVWSAINDQRFLARTYTINANATIGCRLRCEGDGWIWADDGMGWKPWHPCVDDFKRACTLEPA